ncbi:Inositol-tetrakisphosphate 1-kinase [Galemys pyrenaicus]|uniref:inositol-1,3,4-trisphosphate 5/6-kinase n=1 Tax=Galemys pyrenaicus TaxID=202257 RepID=A0A8J6DN64_GALPY|nr:Inositol-tetrakisphosphate 1-kinase [Galemys pyrenaicus]
MLEGTCPVARGPPGVSGCVLQSHETVAPRPTRSEGGLLCCPFQPHIAQRLLVPVLQGPVGSPLNELQDRRVPGGSQSILAQPWCEERPSLASTPCMPCRRRLCGLLPLSPQDLSGLSGLTPADRLQDSHDGSEERIDQGPDDTVISFHQLCQVKEMSLCQRSYAIVQYGVAFPLQEYIDAHPETIVLDPLPAIRTLLDRSKSYELIRKIEAYMKGGCAGFGIWGRGRAASALTQTGGLGPGALVQRLGPGAVAAVCQGQNLDLGWAWSAGFPIGLFGKEPTEQLGVLVAQAPRGVVGEKAPLALLFFREARVQESGASDWERVCPGQRAWAAGGQVCSPGFSSVPDDRICSPPFMELTSLCGEDTMRLLEKNGLAFPFICKTRVAHGTNSHEMAIVFNQEGLNAIQPPCVVQNFINHNAVLYKVFVVGESYTVVQRPSLKNFSAGMSDRESIFFNSHNVSKPESSSVLTALDKIEGVFERPSDEVIRELSRALRQALGVSLFGIDIIINNQTGQHAVIDVNAFPGEAAVGGAGDAASLSRAASGGQVGLREVTSGLVAPRNLAALLTAASSCAVPLSPGYEGVSEFFTDLLNHIATTLQAQSAAPAAPGDTAPQRHSRLLAEQAGNLAAERTCSASPGCCGSMMGQDPPWAAEADTGSVGAGGATKLPHQRLGCTAAVSPSFQQHCVASLTTKASSQ